MNCSINSFIDSIGLRFDFNEASSNEIFFNKLKENLKENFQLDEKNETIIKKNDNSKIYKTFLTFRNKSKNEIIVSFKSFSFGYIDKKSKVTIFSSLVEIHGIKSYNQKLDILKNEVLRYFLNEIQNLNYYKTMPKIVFRQIDLSIDFTFFDKKINENNLFIWKKNIKSSIAEKSKFVKIVTKSKTNYQFLQNKKNDINIVLYNKSKKENLKNNVFRLEISFFKNSIEKNINKIISNILFCKFEYKKSKKEFLNLFKQFDYKLSYKPMQMIYDKRVDLTPYSNDLMKFIEKLSKIREKIYFEFNNTDDKLRKNYFSSAKNVNNCF